MTKKTKAWLIIAAVLFIVGGILFTGVMMALDWDFPGLSTAHFEERIYEVTSDFSEISIITDTADVWIYYTEEESARVVCYTDEKLVPEVSVIDGVLAVSSKDNRRWHERIGFLFEKSKIKVYLPKKAYEKLIVECVTGDTIVSGGLVFDSIDVSARTGDVFCYADADTIDISVTTGDLRLGGKIARSVKLKATTGDISVSNIVISERLCVNGVTGSVKMENCDAGSVFVEMTTGDVVCNFLTPKVISAHSNTGRVSVADSVAGGKCEIKTTTGSIKVTFDEK